MINQFSRFGRALISPVDKINDRLTSYRLVLYFLLALVAWAVLGSFFKGFVPYSTKDIIISAAWLVAICWVVNRLISKFMDIPANKESDLITGLILALIMTPPKTSKDFAILAVAAIGAITAKYIITVYRSHIFNPAAAGAFLAGEIFHKYASWWVGTKFLTPIAVIGGILILRKMKRFTLAGVFLAVYILYLIFGTTSGGDVHFLWLEIIATPVIFFACVMLIEPLTSPVQANKYIPYGILVGLLYSISRLKLSPEEALLIGNLFAFAVAANKRYKLKFVDKIKEAEGIYSYLFSLPPKFSFAPGQYMEWTIAHNKTDSRGNRRYLTISSSPTEPGVMITVKHPPNASAFKRKLDELQPQETILASHLAGDFTLPKDKSQKLAFLAGGVGITPFRSMVKYLIDKNESRDVMLLYSASSDNEVSFHQLFKQAEAVGLKSRYVTDGYLGEEKIKTLMPDYRNRRVYVSGPYGFVHAVETALLKLGASPSNIVVDYFPGYG
jgi:ferredoxin-NADP reductase/Na+-translocating ferredoxin:NAD+ oxidoreductase RnfD subunit